MGGDRKGGNYSPNAKGVCQRCDFKYDLRELRKESTGLKVCLDCWDKRPYDRTPPRVRPEGLPKPNPSPELEPVYIEPGPPDTEAL